MNKYSYLLYLLLPLLLCYSCEKNFQPIGDKTVVIFKQTNLYFDPAFKEDSTLANDSILRLDAGRVILKKVKLPTYALQPEVTLHLTLTSNGDPWDKSGSVFVIPKSTDVSLLDFENNTFDLKGLAEEYPAIIPFSANSKSYIPTVEIMRFMTPFGVGFYSEHERTKERKPVYITCWEDEVNWSQDITHLLSLLEDEVYVGVYIDTWTKEGYNFSLSLDYKESQIPQHQKALSTVIPLVNNIKYASDQKHYDIFSKSPIEVEFTVDQPFKKAYLYYTTTGHGGHSTGDEFNKKENIISLDSNIIKHFIPWRDDCASFRRFNPSSGVWMEKTIWEGKETEERIASSDYSRSNWCPGSQVLPEVIELKNLNQGKHLIKIQIPEAQLVKENEHNYWMVSAVLVLE